MGAVAPVLSTQRASDGRESVARPSVRLAAFVLRPGTVRGRVVPLVRVRRPVRVPFRVHMSPSDHPMCFVKLE